MKTLGFYIKKLKKKLEIVDRRINTYGYIEYRIVSIDGGYQWKKRYKLMYECFIGKINHGFHIHHKDFDKRNDHPDNLIQLSREEHAKVHGKIHNIAGAGSKRMLGKKHTEETKSKMRLAALGSKKSYYERSEEDKAKRRILFSRFGNGAVRKDISISDVVFLRRKGLNGRSIAKKLGCSTQVIDNRLAWYWSSKEYRRKLRKQFGI